MKNYVLVYNLIIRLIDCINMSSRGCMNKNLTFHRKKIVVLTTLCVAAFLLLSIRLGFLMIGKSDYYTQKAKELHERERSIKAERGRILDSTWTE